MQRTIDDIWRDIEECAKSSKEGGEHLCQELVKIMTEPKHIINWEEYAFLDPNKYTRNLIQLNCNSNTCEDDINKLPFHLVMLGWNPEQSSSIHDHANSECCMRILSGSLSEELYEISDSTTSSSHNISKQKTISLQKGEWTSIRDSIGWHRVFNPSKSEPAFSLHLYYPPISQYRAACPTSQNMISMRISHFYSVNGKVYKPS